MRLRTFPQPGLGEFLDSLIPVSKDIKASAEALHIHYRTDPPPDEPRRTNHARSPA
jgi:hypothetical protein